MKLIDILNEIVIQKPVPNNLRKLEEIKAQSEQSKSNEERRQFALQAAELVLPIYEFYYPGDTRVRDSLNAAKEGLYDGGAHQAFLESDSSAAEDVAFAVRSYIGGYLETTINSAIEATKLHFKINEIVILKPNKNFLFYNIVKDFHDINQRLKVHCYNLYNTKEFDKLHDIIIKEYESFYKKYPLEYISTFKSFQEWLEGIKNESVPIHSSGSYYTALMDYEWLYTVAEKLEIDDETMNMIFEKIYSKK